MTPKQMALILDAGAVAAGSKEGYEGAALCRALVAMRNVAIDVALNPEAVTDERFADLIWRAAGNAEAS